MSESTSRAMLFWTAVGAIATVVGAVGAFNFFGSDRPPANEPQANERGEVNLVYTGDTFGCSLRLTVKIGDQSAFPEGNSYVMRNVELGLTEYSVRGAISCTSLGNCEATGSGTIDVDDGSSYHVSWLNTSVGHCDVTIA